FPSQIYSLGWMMIFLVFAFPCSVSVHIRAGDKTKIGNDTTRRPKDIAQRIKQFAVGSDRLVEISCYFSTYATTTLFKPDALSVQVADAKSSLAKSANVLLEQKCDQYSAWVSGLPLGIDSGGIAHSIMVKDATLFCPFFTASCGSKTGFPLGFALQ